ncbi:4'-phosphopantetheinyl transferase superfamily protein [Pandoraea apista]|nr:4'-phosphopantetheinyl transferase superfamily protein [Pandoraea apista]
MRRMASKLLGPRRSYHPVPGLWYPITDDPLYDGRTDRNDACALRRNSRRAGPIRGMDSLFDRGRAQARRCVLPTGRPGGLCGGAHTGSGRRRACHRKPRYAGARSPYLRARAALRALRGAHGRPRLPAHPGLHVSLSHTRGAVAAACAIVPIGIDIEHWNEALDADADFPGMSARERLRLDAFSSVAHTHHAPSPRALAWLRLWTRKESLVKVGETTLDAMPEVDMSRLPMSEVPLRTWQRRVAHGRWAMTDWLDPGLRVTGTVSSAGAVAIERVAP